MTIAEQIEIEALKLKPIERVRLVEKILGSLDRPDPEIEQTWVAESEARYQAFKKGDTKGIPLDEFKPRLSQ
ncbi:addiction module protein [Pontiella sp.]|uniref:addiction module protein n=1 Tax=Pontiella sp. TaxID=2837462 RepID=UPI00356B5A55